MLTPFTPIGATVNIAATNSNQRVTLTAINDQGGKEVRIHNAGPSTVFIEFGATATAAATSSMPIPSGAVEVFTVGPAVTDVAAITASASDTATVYATSGRGA